MDVPSERGLSRAGTTAVAVAGFSTFLGLYATQPLLGHFEAAFHASKAQVGLTVSASTLAVALFAPLVGLVADRTGRRRVIIGSLALLSILTGLAATAGGLTSLIAWRFAEGAGVAAAYVVALAYLTEEAGAHSLGRALAAFVAGNVLGGFAGRSVAGLVTEIADWRLAFVALGAIRLAGAGVAAALLPPSRAFTPRRTRGPGMKALARGLLAPQLVATYAVGFFILFSLVAIFTYAGFYLGAAPFHLGPGAIGMLFTVYLVGAVVTPISGRWIDRVGARRVLAWSFVAAAAGAIMTLVPSIIVVLAGLAITASGAFVAQVAATSYLRTAAPAPLRSLASGVYVTCYYVGGSVAGVAPGLLWSRAGWGGTIALAVIAHVAAIAISARAWREPGLRASGFELRSERDIVATVR
ncbi:MAG TPA: MFS transporter [Kofleriaceae bacterium]|nr:MFS transporter [Kofleriaceae bacterium]